MTLPNIILLIIDWLHGISAAIWVGGNTFFYLVINPAIRLGYIPRKTSAQVSPLYYSIIDGCIIILILTGTLMAFDRLSSSLTTPIYIVILIIKIVIAAWMFILVRSRGRKLRLDKDTSHHEKANDYPRAISLIRSLFTNTTTLLTLGLIIFFLSDLLSYLFQGQLATK